MGIWMQGLRLLACGALLGAGCSSTLETFVCESNADCTAEGKTGGLCEPTQVCSFADPSCAGDGQRYGSASGERSNECVGGNGPDASTANPPPDANPNRPDADTSVSTVDASIGDGEPDAMPPTCVNLSMTVYDDFEGDDEVRVLVNGNIELVCAPTQGTPGADTMASCQYCMPIGADIKLKAESGVSFEALITDCAVGCYTEKECEFVASESCSTTHYFDVDFTGIPPPP